MPIQITKNRKKMRCLFSLEHKTNCWFHLRICIFFQRNSNVFTHTNNYINTENSPFDTRHIPLSHCNRSVRIAFVNCNGMKLSNVYNKHWIELKCLLKWKFTFKALENTHFSAFNLKLFDRKYIQIHQPSIQQWRIVIKTDFMSQIYRSIKSLIRIVKAIYVCASPNVYEHWTNLTFRSVPLILIETCAISITCFQFTFRTFLYLKM